MVGVVGGAVPVERGSHPHSLNRPSVVSTQLTAHNNNSFRWCHKKEKEKKKKKKKKRGWDIRRSGVGRKGGVRLISMRSRARARARGKITIYG